MNSKLAMTTKASSDRIPPSDVRTGFQAQIKGASLADLVQMECLAGAHRVVRVTSAGRVGFLYFRGGAVVHAVARTLAGEPAALEILSWSDGSFEPTDREWPLRETIACSWQGLLLRAAQAHDERAIPGREDRPSPGREDRAPSARDDRASAGREDRTPAQSERGSPSVVALRGDAWSASARRTPTPPPVEDVEFQPTPIEIAGHVLRSEDFQVALRLNADGAIVMNRGGAQDFADIVAYACRLTELIGAQLGTERFLAMECGFKSGRCFIVLESNGDVVALRPHVTADPLPIRSILGL